MSIWSDNPSLDERLDSLAREGYSTSQIAAALGHGITRNSVIGRMKRQGIATRELPKPRAKQKPRPRQIRYSTSMPKFPIEPLKIVPDLTAPEPLTDEYGAFITVLNAKDSHCRAPSGDSALGTFRYCGAQVEKGSYCAFHRQRFFMPATPYHKRGAA